MYRRMYGAELLLEPSENPATNAFKKALFEQGIAAALFAVDDIHTGYERIKKLAVEFRMVITDLGSAIAAVSDDCWGNLIQILQI